MAKNISMESEERLVQAFKMLDEVFVSGQKNLYFLSTSLNNLQAVINQLNNPDEVGTTEGDKEE